jgi:hypothetical protein
LNRRLPVVLIACLAALAALPTYASARATQLSVIQDDAHFTATSDATRTATLDEMRGLGADVVKITMSWRDIAGAGRPANPEDPAAYPASRWRPYDLAVVGAVARGLGVFLNISGPAPNWAVKQRSTPAGVYRPNAAEFGRFAKAVGTRYDGSFPAPSGTVAGNLPAVRLWSVWNEPNLPVFLLPQRSSTRSHYPVSPAIYRALYGAAYGGLVGSGHAKDTILLGELLPVGKSTTTPRSSIRPLEFLRELACVDRHFHAYRGANAKARGCTGYKPLPLSGLAFHPYALSGGPTKRPPNRDDATIGTLSRVTSTIDRLRARHRLAGPRRIPLWLTEFGVQTDPPDYLFGAPVNRVPTFLGMSERLAMRNSRVYSYSQYPLIDDRTMSGFQSGLRFANGKPKPGIYAEYQYPIFVRRSGRSAVEFFGGVRRADNGGSVVLYSRIGSKGKFNKLKTVKLKGRGYFDVRTRASNASRRQFMFTFGNARSITVTAH